MKPTKGYKGHTGTEPISHTLGHAGILSGRAKQYFGIDLKKLPQMSDQELAVYADRAIEMKRLREILPILEKHFEELIQGQVEYEQFIARVLKETEKGSKQIDKQILDAFLLNKGYQNHIKLLQQEAKQGVEKLDAEYQSAFDLNELDFNTAIRMVKMKHNAKKRVIDDKLPEFVAQQRVQESLRQESMSRKELLTYGTAGKPGKKLFEQVKDQAKRFFKIWG